MLECVYELRGVLNLSLFESWDERRVRFEIGDDGTSVIGSFPREEGRDICKKNIHSREPSAEPQDTNINLIRSKLVNEISAHWYLEWDIT